MDRQIVYLDVVFAINLFMDYMVLWATARFGQLRTNQGRLWLAALLGAIYSLGLFSPLVWLGSLPGRVAASAIMVLVAFYRLNPRRFLQAISYFYLIAVVAGGAMLGAIYFFDTSPRAFPAMGGLFVFLSNVRYTWLLAATAAALLMGRWGAVFIKRNFLKSLLRVPVIMRFGETRIPVQALIDTGNQLQDPLTKRPVMIAEYSLLRAFLPLAARQAFEANPEPELEKVVSALEGTIWASRVRLIPFTSIGKSRGMLLGFRPDEVLILAENTPVRVKDIVVGIYQKPLSLEGKYRALLNPEVLRSTMGF